MSEDESFEKVFQNRPVIESPASKLPRIYLLLTLYSQSLSLLSSTTIFGSISPVEYSENPRHLRSQPILFGDTLGACERVQEFEQRILYKLDLGRSSILLPSLGSS